jgi:hypothetical protein
MRMKLNDGFARRYPNGLPAPAIPSETYTASQAQAAQQAAEDILQVADTFLRVHG